LSGGEQQLINFAIGLSLAELHEIKNGSRSNLLIMDEPLENLGVKNSEAVVSYMTAFCKDRKGLFISNDETLKSLISDKIHIVKENGVSRLET
jgi:DNA repair exonuclease SbcCD ATPase subunit